MTARVSLLLLLTIGALACSQRDELSRASSEAGPARTEAAPAKAAASGAARPSVEVEPARADAAAVQAKTPRLELDLADGRLRATAPGSLDLAGGEHAFPLGSGASLKVTLPEGFAARRREAYDADFFEVQRPARAGEAEELTVRFWIFEPPSRQPLEVDLSGASGPRPLRALGGELPFFTRQEAGRTVLATRVLTEAGDLNLEGVAQEPALAELEAILSSTRLIGLRQLPESERLVGTTRRCPLVVIDSQPPLKVRAEPSQEAAVVGGLDDGQPVTVDARRRGWLRLSSPIKGWIWHRNTREDCGGLAGDAGPPTR